MSTFRRNKIRKLLEAGKKIPVKQTERKKTCYQRLRSPRNRILRICFRAPNETMISVRARTFLPWSKIDKGKQKTGRRKGNWYHWRETKPYRKWAIAACTESKVKEIVDDDSITSKKKSLIPIDDKTTSKVVNAQVAVRLHCFLVCVDSTPASSTPRSFSSLSHPATHRAM